MAKKIIEVVLERKAVLVNDQNEANKNMALAVAAINGGVRSAAWKTYMLQFVEKDGYGMALDPAQLERLLATDGTLGDPALDRNRAYLVSNAVCGPGSTNGFDMTVNSVDQGVGGGCA